MKLIFSSLFLVFFFFVTGVHATENEEAAASDSPTATKPNDNIHELDETIKSIANESLDPDTVSAPRLQVIN